MQGQLLLTEPVAIPSLECPRPPAPEANPLNPHGDIGEDTVVADYYDFERARWRVQGQKC